SRNRFYSFFKEPGFSKAMKLLTRLDRISAECGCALPELVLRWTMEKGFVSTVLFGAQRAERVRANVKAMSLRLSPEKLAAIDHAIAQEYAAEA
ncbi:MAG: aldo/keto reductase, partial [Lachnospiraceae bacterium]|nr:aldo/keto reductase [Lachnospiraceae bacterium]